MQDEQCSEITEEPTRENRIRVNLMDYFEATGDYNHLTWRAANAAARRKRAIDNLKSLDAHAELEKLNVR